MDTNSLNSASDKPNSPSADKRTAAESNDTFPPEKPLRARAGKRMTAAVCLKPMCKAVADAYKDAQRITPDEVGCIAALHTGVPITSLKLTPMHQAMVQMYYYRFLAAQSVAFSLTHLFSRRSCKKEVRRQLRRALSSLHTFNQELTHRSLLPDATKFYRPGKVPATTAADFCTAVDAVTSRLPRIATAVRTDNPPMDKDQAARRCLVRFTKRTEDPDSCLHKYQTSAQTLASEVLREQADIVGRNKSVNPPEANQ